MSTLELLEALTKLAAEYNDPIYRKLDLRSVILNFVHDWQTLIAAVVAFFPASLAAVFVWRQVNEQRQQFTRLEDQRARRARLKLIYTLPGISQNLDTMYSGLLKADFDSKLHYFSQDTLNDVLDAAIVSDKITFDFSKQYISHCQKYSSLVRLYVDHPSDERLAKLYRQLAVIDIYTDKLYPFVRFETETIELPAIRDEEIKTYLKHNLRRSNSISGTNLERLFSAGHLPGRFADV